MVPGANNEASTRSGGGDLERVEVQIDVEIEVEFTEEEERINDELFEHPTRDDVHEQRERGQKCEGVIHAHCHAARPLEPHGFDGTRLGHKIG
jgi:hypothetical protein